MAQELRVVWDDFSGGDYGKTSPFKAAPNTFKGVNVIQYRDGLLGPRQALVSTHNTGLPVGAIKGFGWNATTGADLWVVIGTKVWTRGTSTWFQSAASLSITPTERVVSVASSNTITYILVYGDGLYRVNHNPNAAPTLTKITSVTTAMAGRSLCVYNNRLMLGAKDTNLVYYSNAADFNTFSTTNYFEVGDNLEVRYMAHQRDSLCLIKRDASVWIMTGVPGTGTLRKYYPGSHPAGIFSNFCVARGDGTILLAANDGQWPVTFDGANLKDFKYLEFASGVATDSTHIQAARIDNRQDILFLPGTATSSGTGYQFINGAWTTITFGQQVSTYVAEPLQHLLYFTNGGSAGAVATFYSLDQTAYDKPGNGDASSTQMDASVVLAPWSSPDGREVRVRQIIVDYKAWNTGGALDAGLTMWCTVFKNPGGTQEIASADQTISIPQGDLPSGGEYRRTVFNIGDQGMGSAFEISLLQIRSLAIASVTAIVEVQPERPRS